MCCTTGKPASWREAGSYGGTYTCDKVAPVDTPAPVYTPAPVLNPADLASCSNMTQIIPRILPEVLSDRSGGDVCCYVYLCGAYLLIALLEPLVRALRHLLNLCCVCMAITI